MILLYVAVRPGVARLGLPKNVFAPNMQLTTQLHKFMQLNIHPLPNCGFYAQFAFKRENI